MGTLRNFRGLAGNGVWAGLARVARAGEWWEYKLVPIFAMFYATALVADLPLHSLWKSALLLLLAVGAGAVYVSVLNDVADRHEDLAAGKHNRVVGRSPAFVALLLAVPIAVGLAVAWNWREDPLRLYPYLAAWTAFTLYSLPPFRLKARGVAGVLADACGAHLFPTLVAVAIVLRFGGVAPNPIWLAATSLWAFAYGLRGILWHQLLDADADRVASVSTFVQRSGRDRAVALARWVIFPVELCAFSVVLSQMPSWLPLLFLFLYVLLVRKKLHVFVMQAVIVEPRPRYLIILHEYYDLFLPLSLLLASSLRWQLDLAALFIHFLLFPRRLLHTARDLWKLRPF
ncbi:MAG TPA: UbiA family prenyltransferase [Allosphingosinicella sp.]|jgi:1,4-dihydroxy-2-naphthoate octaprenyltransferase